MASARTLRFLAVVAAVVSVGLAVGTSSLLGSSQGGKTVTVGASGCDYTTVQAAIDAVPDGSTIEVRTGLYKETLTIRNRDGLTLRGEGPDKVTLDGNGPQQKDVTPAILILGSRNVTIAGFRIVNSRRGLEADDSTLVFIDGNVFDRNLRTGILFLRSQGEVTGNTVQNTLVDITGSNGEGVTISESRVKLAGNTVTGNASDGIRVGFFDQASQSEVTGAGNVVRDNMGGNLGGSAPTSLLADPPAEGMLDEVAVPTDVPTIQEAIDRVKTGGTVTVAAGTYKEKVEIYKSITIRGAGADKTVLQAPGADWLALNIATNQPQVTIEGLRVTGGRFGVRAATGTGGTVALRDMKIDSNGAGKPDDVGVSFGGQVAATLDRVTSSGNVGGGIYVAGTAKLTARQCTVADNSSVGLAVSYGASAALEASTISRNGSYGVSVSSTAVAELKDCTVAANTKAGLTVSGSAHLTATNSRITGTKPSSDGGFGTGIFVRNEGSTTLQNCTVSENVSRGIWLCDSSQATLTDTRVLNTKVDPAGNLGYGVRVENKSSLSLKKCTISSNASSGIKASHETHVVIDGSTVSENAGQGIFIDGSARAEITNSQVLNTKKSLPPSSCCGSGIVGRGESQVTIRSNTISGNAEAGVWIGDNAQVTVTANTISNNQWGGVQIRGGGRATISDNTINDNQYMGVLVVNNAQAEVANNRILDTKPSPSPNSCCGSGVAADNSSKVTIQGNTISGNVDCGVLILGAAQGSVIANTITGNRIQGVYVGGTASATISQNTIESNSGCGVKADSSVSIAGAGNTISSNSGGMLCGTTSKFPKGFGGGK
jgi:parallel beta-helix repeat protein